MRDYLFDTNIISETIKSSPNNNVTKWLRSIPLSSSYISVLTIGEIRKGIAKLKDQERNLKLNTWLEVELLTKFNGRIIPISIEVADLWGRISAAAKQTLPGIDSLLAATALYHNMKLVTRNTKDFTVPGLDIINPWNL